MRPFVAVKPYPLPDDMPGMSRQLEYMLPERIPIENGLEMLAQVFTDWCEDNGIALATSSQANRTRMPTTSGPTAPSAMSYWTRTCSRP